MDAVKLDGSGILYPDNTVGSFVDNSLLAYSEDNFNPSDPYISMDQGLQTGYFGGALGRRGFYNYLMNRMLVSAGEIQGYRLQVYCDDGTPNSGVLTLDALGFGGFGGPLGSWTGLANSVLGNCGLRCIPSGSDISCQVFVDNIQLDAVLDSTFKYAGGKSGIVQTYGGSFFGYSPITDVYSQR